MKNYKNQQINRYIGYVFLVIYIIGSAIFPDASKTGDFHHRQYFIASHDFPLRGGRVLHPADDGCLGGRDDHGRTDGRGFRLCHE